MAGPLGTIPVGLMLVRLMKLVAFGVVQVYGLGHSRYLIEVAGIATESGSFTSVIELRRGIHPSPEKESASRQPATSGTSQHPACSSLRT
jgi:hypothetical protein